MIMKEFYFRGIKVSFKSLTVNTGVWWQYTLEKDIAVLPRKIRSPKLRNSTGTAKSLF